MVNIFFTDSVCMGHLWLGLKCPKIKRNRIENGPSLIVMCIVQGATSECNIGFTIEYLGDVRAKRQDLSHKTFFKDGMVCWLMAEFGQKTASHLILLSAFAASLIFFKPSGAASRNENQLS